MSYIIRKTLAKNTLSEVLLADFSGQRQSCRVLVKTVLPDLTEDIADRLNFAMAFNNGGIQEIVDYGECKNKVPRRHYLSTRFCPGVTLAQVLSRLDTLQKKTPMPFVAHVICSVCNALEYLHDIVIDKKNKMTVVHGGLCLDNIVITMNGDVHLVDAGIADRVKYRYTGTELVENRATAFQHPELTFDIPIRKYHEIYSTGMLLLCMLIGKNHFEGFCDGHEADKLKSVGHFFPSIPGELDKIIERATKFRGLGKFIRYDTITDFHYDLCAFTGKESIGYNRELSGLFVYALFNHLENEPKEHHEQQHKKAKHYIDHGNDNTLKMLLKDLVKFKDQGIVYEDFVDENKISPRGNHILSTPAQGSTVIVDDVYIPQGGYDSSLGNDGPGISEKPPESNTSNAVYEPSEPYGYPLPSAASPVNYPDGIEVGVPIAPGSNSGHANAPTIRLPVVPPQDPATDSPPLSENTSGGPIYSNLQTPVQNTSQPLAVREPPTVIEPPTVQKPPKVQEPPEVQEPGFEELKTPVLQGFFQKNAFNSEHAFSKIVKKKYVVDAHLFFTPPEDKKSGLPHTTETIATGTNRNDSPLESFSHLLKKNGSPIEKKHLESFSNLLKKENN